jgi:hypothetical protein
VLPVGLNAVFALIEKVVTVLGLFNLFAFGRGVGYFSEFFSLNTCLTVEDANMSDSFGYLW